LWSNGWMQQGGTWYGGRPQPRRLCVRWGPSPLPKMGTAPNFRSISVVAKRLDGGLRCHLVWKWPRPRRLCVRSGTHAAGPRKRAHPSQFLAHVCCGQTAGQWCKGFRRPGAGAMKCAHLESPHVSLTPTVRFWSNIPLWLCQAAN